MMHAYNELYLERARMTLGSMLDFAIHTLSYPLSSFWDMFVISPISKRFEQGESEIIVGTSGIELALLVTHDILYNDICIPLHTEKSPEYWAGWALAYYQWANDVSFAEIEQSVNIEEIVHMYSPYHELDIRQFCDWLHERIRRNHLETNLKRIRKSRGLTQQQLANETNIPLRTIQQYEQGQKSINGARAEYVISLSKALYCPPIDLLER